MSLPIPFFLFAALASSSCLADASCDDGRSLTALSCCPGLASEDDMSLGLSWAQNEPIVGRDDVDNLVPGSMLRPRSFLFLLYGL